MEELTPCKLKGWSSGQACFLMIFHDISNYCSCAISSCELSVCAVLLRLFQLYLRVLDDQVCVGHIHISSVCQDCSTPPTKLSPLERRCPRPTPNIAIVIQLPYFPTGLSPLSRPSFSTLPSWNIQTTSEPFMTLSMIPRPPLTHRRFL